MHMDARLVKIAVEIAQLQRVHIRLMHIVPAGRRDLAEIAQHRAADFAHAQYAHVALSLRHAHVAMLLVRADVLKRLLKRMRVEIDNLKRHDIPSSITVPAAASPHRQAPPECFKRCIFHRRKTRRSAGPSAETV